MTSHPEPSMPTDPDKPQAPAPTTGAGGKPPGPTSRWRRLLRFALMMILLLLAVRLVVGYTAQARLKQVTDRITASGESLRFADFAPPDVATGENATDFLEAAGLLLDAEASEQDATLADEFHQRLREIDQRRQPVTPEDLALFRRVVDSHDLVLRILDEGMSRERARFDVDYFTHDPASLNIPNLIKRLQLSRLLRARAWLAVDDDRPEDAWHEVARIFRLAGWLAEEMPTVIHAVVARAVAQQGLMTARDIVRIAPPAPEEMSQVLAQARRWDPRATHARVLRAERAAMATTLLNEDSWHQLVASLGPARLNLGPWPVDFYFGSVLTSWPFRPWIYWNVTAYIAAMTQQIEICEIPTYQRPAGRREHFADIAVVPKWATLARNVMPNLLESCTRRDLLIADFDLMEIAFRLAEQHRETGDYPPVLDHLADATGRDPFSGEPYRYRLEAGSAVVYSIAGNRTDDGGTPPTPGTDQMPATKPMLELDSGDLVWRLEPAAP